MKLIASFVLILIFNAYEISACTTFFLSKNGQMAFGRNYDWITDAGMVCTNHRGLAKTSMKIDEGETISWVSKYGSITFNQYGKEFPNGGMNEKGLVVEMMWLDGSEYPKKDKRASVNVLQWIQYTLDNCSSVAEAIAVNKIVRISSANPPIHFLLADRSGKAATIEFLNGKMKVHKGKDLPYPVLANTDYATSSKLMMDNSANITRSSKTYSDNSIQRFSYACSMVNEYHAKEIDKPIVDYSFEILDKVSQDEFTKWSIVYDISKSVIHFKTDLHTDVKSVALGEVDFSCSASPLVLDMNQQLKGNITKQLVPYSIEKNAAIVNRAALESKQQVGITDETAKGLIEYPSGIKCESK